MKRLLTLLALVLCSCAETFVGKEVARPNNAKLPDLTASFADEEATRTYIEEGKYLRWNEDDRLTIFFGNTLNRQYKFNGKTGDNSGTFSLVPDGMLGTGNAFDHIYALYPYNADVRITDEGVISLALPAVQNYAENSFGRGANTMLAVTENVEDTFLSFKNTCGYLKLKLYNAEGASIKSIDVKGNSGERLAGAATATIAFGEAPVLAMADDATTYVTLNCDEGVVLGTTTETATEFWFVLPATTFAEGLTISATDTEGKVFKKSTTKEVVIERNAIQPMAVLEAKFVATKPANNEIWYTNGSTTEATKPYETNVFGAKIVSNTYDTAKECWVIKFDSEVTTIGYCAFYNCSSLTSVTIPDSVTTIGYHTFTYCDSLTSVTIPDNVTYIGEGAFRDCSNLQEFKGKFASKDGRCLIVDGTLISFAPAGLTEYTILDSATTIGRSAFYGCDSLTSVTIPDSVTTMGDWAFGYCSSLTSVTIPDSVTTIGLYAFYSCSSLTSVTIPDSVTTIGDYAFENCNSLTSVTIPDSVTAIGKRAFVRCSSLQELKGKFASEDSRCLIVDGILNSFAPAGLTEYTIYNSVTTIGDNVFYECSNLESVTIPDSVTTIGRSAFYDCDSLTSITIPDSVTTIGDYAFEYCSSLTSVTIGDSVTTIGDDAFSWCSSLVYVYCQTLTPPILCGALFYNTNYDLKIFVKSECVEVYRSEQHWREYAHNIIGYNFELGEIVTDTLHPYAVDLGLSVKWACCNIGASRPEEYGDYYAWGEICVKNEYTKENSICYNMSIWDISGNPLYDAAVAIWGNTWRIPTDDEFTELCEQCEWMWTTYNGVDGMKVTGPNGNYIFLPAADISNVNSNTGKYWCATSGPFTWSADYIWFQHSGYVDSKGWTSRHLGCSIRPVKD